MLHVILIALCCVTMVSGASAQALYWTDIESQPGTPSIRRTNVSGAVIETLVQGLSDPRGLALDLANRQMYWAEPGVGQIMRASLDGIGPVESVVATEDGAGDITLDIPNGKMYWTDSNNAQINMGLTSGRIRRANLDGSDVEDLIATDLRHPIAIAHDPINGKIYWTNVEGNFDGLGSIQRADLDGSGFETIITGIDESNGLAIDHSQKMLYWTEIATGRIQRQALTARMSKT